MAKRASLLWVDLEMTGLDPVEDRILEVAVIATDWEFKEIARYTGVVKVAAEVIKRRMVGEFWQRNPKTYQGLVQQNEQGRPTAEIERELLEFVAKYCRKEVFLAGNSIHQDRKFIDQEWPDLAQRLHYRILDVSAWKIYFEHALGVKFHKSETHRALEDIRGSMEELKYYLKFLRKPRGVGRRDMNLRTREKEANGISN